MAYRSLGEFIEAARGIGDVKEIHGANLESEVGCLTELSAERNGPLLLFDQFAGYDPTFRVATNVMAGHRNSLLRPQVSHDSQAKGQATKSRELKLIPPVEVTDGPALTHTLS